ncbi:hypothetical protein [Capnocytophaga sputigena]|jgi:hypothetical protein|uniref:hypothetical protein n=1 Tax=Capnocytophaga sputigena TaxID=1019 RepID=UPI0028D79D61|nr:hypothetical protein [Capnocytophaga sputigena]
METNVNKVQALELDEKDLVNAFEVEELEKRYEMGWFSGGSMNGELTVDHNGNLGGKVGVTVPIN